jgi:hypothetical protein
MAEGSSMMMMMMMMMMMVAGCMCLSLVAVGGMAMMPPQTQAYGSEADQEPLDEVSTEIKRAGEGCVVLYDNIDGTGKNVEFCLDDKNEYRVNNMKSYDGNDMASAVDVGEGAQVRLYADKDLRGDMIRLKQGWHTIRDSWKNDVVSSLMLKKS